MRAALRHDRSRPREEKRSRDNFTRRSIAYAQLRSSARAPAGSLLRNFSRVPTCSAILVAAPRRRNVRRARNSRDRRRREKRRDYTANSAGAPSRKKAGGRGRRIFIVSREKLIYIYSRDNWPRRALSLFNQLGFPLSPRFSFSFPLFPQRRPLCIYRYRESS